MSFEYINSGTYSLVWSVPSTVGSHPWSAVIINKSSFVIRFRISGIYVSISSIAFGIAEPSVDGNVLRVLKRIAGSFDDITKEKVKKELENDVREIMPKDRPGDFNQSLMELGATVCLPNAISAPVGETRR